MQYSWGGHSCLPKPRQTGMSAPRKAVISRQQLPGQTRLLRLEVPPFPHSGMVLPVNWDRWRETTYVHSDACARPGADRRGPAPVQEAPGAEWFEEGAAEARVLREAVRAASPGRASQATRDPKGNHGPRARPADLTGYLSISNWSNSWPFWSNALNSSRPPWIFT